MALEDAQNRHWITEEELCYDGNTNNDNMKPPTWRFRFKESAGTDWTGTDPLYWGQPCRRLAFFRSGTVREVQQPHLSPTINISNNNNNIDSTETTTTTASATLNSASSEGNGPMQFTDPPLCMAWRFLTRSMDLSQRPHGSLPSGNWIAENHGESDFCSCTQNSAHEHRQ
jgi:hypothetical protein